MHKDYKAIVQLIVKTLALPNSQEISCTKRGPVTCFAKCRLVTGQCNSCQEACQQQLFHTKLDAFPCEAAVALVQCSLNRVAHMCAHRWLWLEGPNVGLQHCQRS